MKLSYHWLKELTGCKLSPEELAEILNLKVAAVEKISKLEKGLDKVVVAEILAIKKHPQADKLQLVKVKTGNKKEEIRNIVCGAFNIKVGDKVPLALPGAKLVNGMIIQESIIRGIKSEGMLCAEDELGVGEDHTGILILDKSAEIGEKISKILGLDDTIIEIENSALTHRPDLFSHWGFAREITACLGEIKKRDKRQKIESKDKKSKFSKGLLIKVENYNDCPRYMAVVIDNVKIAPSPFWLRNQLRNLGIRPINNVVDITNYVMMETGEPLHAFDYERLANKHKYPTNNTNSREIYGQIRENPRMIIIRRAKTDEKLLCLDGVERKLDKDILVIADVKKPIALAGIMGGEESGITEKTKTVVIEAANFNAVTIRRGARKLSLRTEANLRFEKGLPLNFPEEGLKRAIELIQKFAQGQPASQIYDIKSLLTEKKLINNKKILLNLVKVKQTIGQDLPTDFIFKTLELLGFSWQVINLPQKLITLAKKQLGKPFKYGASTFLEAPQIFDCSSLVRYLFREVGIELPRVTIEQIECGDEVDLKSLRAGDLVFSRGFGKPHYSKKYPQGVGHVGIFLGQQKILHASRKRKRVVVDSFKNFCPSKDFRGARRIFQPGKYFLVTVPVFRPDIEQFEDLVEEIVRLYGYEKIVPSAIKSKLSIVSKDSLLKLERKIKSILIALGFDEVYNYSFYGESLINLLKLPKELHLEIANPLNPDQRYLRISLIPKLLENAVKNISYFNHFKIFEIGKVYNHKEEKYLGGLILEKNKKIFYLIKGLVETILEKIGFEKNQISYQRGENFNYQYLNYLTNIFVDKKIVGIFGEVNKALKDNLKISSEIGVFEINLETIKDLEIPAKTFSAISAYPPILRDLAFLAPKNVIFNDLFQTIKNFHPLIYSVEPFDIFESEKLGENVRNIAFHLTFQSFDRTLKSEEIDKIIYDLVKTLEQKFEARLRNF